MSTTGSASEPPVGNEVDSSADVLAGAAAEVVMVGLRGGALVGAVALRVAATTGEVMLLVPLLGDRLRALDRRWQSDRDSIQGRARSLFEELSGRVIDGVLGSIDLTSLVLKNVDLDRILEELDLPEIIRESSGTLAADTIDGLRVQGMHADSSLSRFIDRLLGRRDGDARGDGSLSPQYGRATTPLGGPSRADA